MITVNERQKVHRSNVNSESAFQIKATGKAFRILSDGLYSDKITAIVRELSCNAYDAHVEAGTLDRPFTIHLPNALEPWFSIRDFGTGLSHDHVMTLYRTYFESTKDDSNDFIGCLGLGSKSPFSYVDNFSVTSYFNGTKRIYNAFINEDQVPSIALMNETDTSSDNGLEISLAVQEKDFEEFRRKTEVVMHYFKIQPEVVGNSGYNVIPVTYSLKGDDWGIRAEGWSYTAKAVMGNVCYPLHDINTDSLVPEERGLLRCNIDLFFKMGELEVSASRESLSYDKRTIASIVAKIKLTLSEISETMVNEIEKCDTLWDARCKYQELRSKTLFAVSDIVDKQEFSWNGHTVSDNYITHDIPDLYFKHFVLKKNLYKDSQKMSRENKVSGMRPSYTKVIIENDLTTGAFVRCKAFLIDKTQKAINEGTKAEKDLYLVQFKDKKERETFLSKMGFASDHKFKLASELPKPVRGKSAGGNYTYNPKNSVKILRYDGKEYDGNTNSSAWVKESIDFEDGGFYVPIDRYKVNGNLEPNYLDNVLRILNAIGAWDIAGVVYGVKTAKVEDMVSHNGWVNLFDYMRKYLAEYAKTDEVVKIMSAKKQAGLVDMSIAEKLHGIIDEWTEAPEWLCQLMEEFRDVENYVKKDQIVIKAIENYGIEVKNENMFNLFNLYKEYTDKYPLLSHMFCRLWHLEENNKKHAREYILAIEMLRESNSISAEKTVCEAA